MIIISNIHESGIRDWFQNRTKRHISLVRKYCKLIDEHDHDRFDGILERGEKHDQSKFDDPEVEPYVWITWKHKCKADGIPFEAPDGMKERMTEASEHHVRNNAHHPEYHSSQEGDFISKENRNKAPPGKVIDATKMGDLDIAEMTADWRAMSDELGDDPRKWADDNVNVRWKFSDSQKNLIYDLIDAIF